MGILQSKVVVILFFLPLKVVISSRICVAQDNFEVFSLVLVAFLPAYSTPHARNAHRAQKRTSNVSGLVTAIFRLPYGCWEFYLSPLKSLVY